jgi:methionyl-tRNA formyltransferase
VRAIILGNKDLAVDCLGVIARHGIDVVGIVLNPDDRGIDEGLWYRSLKKAAVEQNIPFIQPATVSSEEGVAFLREKAPDFLFSFSYSRIVKGFVLSEAKVIALNVHFAELPQYRGCLPIVYALANGDPHVGVTLHIMDEGIDTGAILDQAQVMVEERDTAYSMYFKCVEAGTALMDRNLPSLIAGTLQPRSQTLEIGSYNKQVYPNDRWLPQGLSPEALSCFVRAHTFPGYPSARVRYGGAELDVLCHDGSFEIPGLKLSGLSSHALHELLSDRKESYENLPH